MQLFEGETVTIIGKSGSGKSTLVKMIMKLENRGERDLLLEGLTEDDGGYDNLEARVGFISQHPKASMSPHFTVEHIVQEPLDIAGKRKLPLM